MLCSLGYIALLEPTVFEGSSIKVPQQKDKGWAGIIKTVVNNLLMKNKMPGTDADDEPEWQEPSPECEAKVRRREWLRVGDSSSLLRLPALFRCWPSNC